jgi:hypothetical protein
LFIPYLIVFIIFLFTNCREMIVVHPDVDFLDDMAGKLKEVFALFLNYPYHCVII